MVGPEVTSDRAGVAALVEARVFEADRERVDVPRPAQPRTGPRRRSKSRRLRRGRRRSARPSAGGARPRRGTRLQNCSRRVLEVELREFELEADSSTGKRGPCRLPSRGRVPAGKLPDRPPDRVGSGDVFVEEVADQAGVIERAADAGMSEHRLGLGAEGQAAAGQLAVEERLLAHPVAHQDQPAASLSPRSPRRTCRSSGGRIRALLLRRDGPGFRCRTTVR